MPHRRTARFPTQNRLLASLPKQEIERLLPQMELITFPLRQTLLAAGEANSFVYFPEKGWVSMVLMLQHGDATEVGLIGREGMVGFAALLGIRQSNIEAIWQSEGTARRLPAAVFREAFDRNPAVRDHVLRFAQAFHLQVAQTAACNGRHTLNQRLARWILMARDRADSDAFPMTHEFLATMLGVRRSGVTVAAGQLQKAGYIIYGSGRLMILDHGGLQARACECHATVHHEYQELLSFDGPEEADHG
ncbi:Crp/Fnr family transcriptional regulator [Neoroseomonas lacus]|uniref:Crp/Fnr family transcriptional regulator n=1 Tax=Neoroseomonas lacus TaxID=287609 RepID=UPI001E33C72D|nr:Crp/Fnr family transcriptional regulator [Neoroseomonas lacus]